MLNFGAEATAGIVYEDFVLQDYTRSCIGCFWWNAEIRKCIRNDTGVDVGLTQVEALQKQLLPSGDNQFDKVELPDGEILAFSAQLREAVLETNRRF